MLESDRFNPQFFWIGREVGFHVAVNPFLQINPVGIAQRADHDIGADTRFARQIALGVR